MKKNVGGMDRTARLVIGPLLLLVGVAAMLQLFSLGTIGTVVVVAIGAILTVTGATQRCPLNTLLGIDTCPVNRS